MKRRGRVRISGGQWRGRMVVVPDGIRPTGSQVREALASIWSARLAGASVLELFAGSGAVGLEALSRGAAEAVLVDGTPSVVRVLRGNCEALAADRCRVLQLRLPGGLAASPVRVAGPFDLIFADPPYRFDAFEHLLAAIAARLDADGEAVVEHSSRVELPLEVNGLRRIGCREYGETMLAFYRHRS